MAQTDRDGQARWRFRDIDSGAAIVRQERLSQTIDSPAADSLRIRAGHGSKALAYTRISPSRVISELAISVPIRTDRAGLQALVHVVLPRTKDKNTADPITVTLAGTSCQSVTQWETLVVRDIPKKLEREVRILQLSHEQAIDVREAYVDMVLINVYGGAGVTNVALGDPTVDGAATIPTHGLDGAAIRSAGYRRQAQSSAVGTAKARDGLLYVRNRPLFVRMLDHNGEPWEQLKSLGINTIRLSAPVTFEQLDTARQLGLWIVAPPPRTQLGTRTARHFDRVIAWNLGSGLDVGDLTVISDTARMLRAAGGLGSLPIACGPTCSIGAFSRTVDVLIHRRSLAAYAEDDAYQRLLKRRIDQSRPTTVHWAAIQTQPLPMVVEQARLLGCGETPRLCAEEIRSSALLAVATGARGVYFRSRSPLDTNRSEDRRRSLAIRRTNLELNLIEPWLAAGQRLATPTNAPPNYSISALSTNQAALYLLRRKTSVAPPINETPRFVIPNISETAGIYRIDPGGIVPASSRRVTGGVEVALGNSSADCGSRWQMLLATRDAAIVRALADRVNSTSAALASAIETQLSRDFDPEIAKLDDSTRERYYTFKAALAHGDLTTAHQAGAAMLANQQSKRHHDWCAAWLPLAQPTACGLAVHASTCQDLRDFLRSVPRSGQSMNLLPGGGCDNAENVQRGGWHSAVDDRRATADVGVSRDCARAGDGCLQITADWSPQSASQFPNEHAIAWTNSPNANVGAGQIVRIDGWVKLERPLENGARLVISDSLTGPAMGLRFQRTQHDSWQPFTIYRGAAESTSITLTFALTGPGTAWVDEISIAPVLVSESL